MHVGGENLSDIDDIGRREQEGGDGRKGLSPATVGSVTNHTWITEIAKARTRSRRTWRPNCWENRENAFHPRVAIVISTRAF